MVASAGVCGQIVRDPVIAKDLAVARILGFAGIPAAAGIPRFVMIPAVANPVFARIPVVAQAAQAARIQPSAAGRSRGARHASSCARALRGIPRWCPMNRSWGSVRTISRHSSRSRCTHIARLISPYPDANTNRRVTRAFMRHPAVRSSASHGKIALCLI